MSRRIIVPKGLIQNDVTVVIEIPEDLSYETDLIAAPSTSTSDNRRVYRVTENQGAYRQYAIQRQSRSLPVRLDSTSRYGKTSGEQSRSQKVDLNTALHESFLPSPSDSYKYDKKIKYRKILEQDSDAEQQSVDLNSAFHESFLPSPIYASDKSNSYKSTPNYKSVKKTKYRKILEQDSDAEQSVDLNSAFHESFLPSPIYASDKSSRRQYSAGQGYSYLPSSNLGQYNRSSQTSISLKQKTSFHRKTATPTYLPSSAYVTLNQSGPSYATLATIEKQQWGPEYYVSQKSSSQKISIPSAANQGSRAKSTANSSYCPGATAEQYARYLRNKPALEKSKQSSSRSKVSTTSPTASSKGVVLIQRRSKTKLYQRPLSSVKEGCTSQTSISRLSRCSCGSYVIGGDSTSDAQSDDDEVPECCKTKKGKDGRAILANRKQCSKGLDNLAKNVLPQLELNSLKQPAPQSLGLLGFAYLESAYSSGSKCCNSIANCDGSCEKSSSNI